MSRASTAAAVAATLQPGDVFKVERTFRAHYRSSGRSLYAEDVASGEAYRVDLTGSLKIELVKKVARQKSDYSVGDVLTADQIRATQWRRGTIIHLAGKSYDRFAMVLQGDGKWHALDVDWWDDSGFTFEELYSKFTLDHIAP